MRSNRASGAIHLTGKRPCEQHKHNINTVVIIFSTTEQLRVTINIKKYLWVLRYMLRKKLETCSTTRNVFWLWSLHWWSSCSNQYDECLEQDRSLLSSWRYLRLPGHYGQPSLYEYTKEQTHTDTHYLREQSSQRHASKPSLKKSFPADTYLFFTITIFYILY